MNSELEKTKVWPQGANASIKPAVHGTTALIEGLARHGVMQNVPNKPEAW
jgi:hypothetical protein